MVTQENKSKSENVAIPVRPLFSDFLDVFNSSHMPTCMVAHKSNRRTAAPPARPVEEESGSMRQAGAGFGQSVLGSDSQVLSKKWCWQWWSGENLLLFLATLLLALLHSCLIYIRHSGLVLIAGQLNIQQEQKPDQPW